ncbi:glycosyltransferase [Granulicella sp. L60]|uniref:glycosyltransferase n=1 Tax=Granulicella sp. L60 TaxID=1641866 RepID=UPI00131ED0DC|nr:nucleotide disphospho-sugar-binding domain-containing protein [Granulicella sp. L60]
MKTAFISLPAPGHINPMTALARKLRSRGHEVTMLAIPDAVEAIQATGLECLPFSEKDFPVGWSIGLFRTLSQLQGEDAVRYSFETLSQYLSSALKHLPATIAKAGVDAIVLDTTQYYLGLLPMQLQIPYVHVSPGLPLDLSGATPPRFFGWPFEATAAAIKKNRIGVSRVLQFLEPCIDVAKAYSKRMGMDIDWKDPDPTISKLAWIAQMPREFDFPGDHWPPQFHYTGPFHDGEGREEVPFSWENLTGEPLIYASMGTLQNGHKQVFQVIVDAAEKLSGFQLVLSIGNNLNTDEIRTSLSKTIVVNKAPQLQLLQRAWLCVTHAGMNTALEALTQGVPMVALPVTNDQPAVAARIIYHHVGEVLSLSNLTASDLNATMNLVMSDPSYRQNSRFFQKAIAESRGLEKASQIIETSFGY